MNVAFITRRFWIPLLGALILLGAVRNADAQGFISPFIGYNFSGDSGCPDITNCKDKHSNYGVGFGALGSVVGFEAEIAHTNDFFGASSTQSTSVLTFMTNFMLAPKFGPIQPYGEVGGGLIRTSVESAGQNTDQSQVGWDVGGGIIGYVSRHVGIRGDVRYFHSFQLSDFSLFPGLIPVGQEKLDFGRASIAVVFKF
jgi:opacity protein-like surface antigen